MSPLSPRRWRTVRAAALAAALAVGLAAVQQGDVLAGDRDVDRPALHAQAVAVTAAGERVPLDATALDRMIPGTRALDVETAVRQRDWLAEGTLPGSGGPWVDLGRDALLDLHVLTGDNGAALAGLSPHWRYVWPRDAAFVAAALARTGHLTDAERVLGYLQQARPAAPSDGSPSDGSPSDGSPSELSQEGFQARYLPDGSGDVPDDRGIEADGAGWLLWALGMLAAEVPDADRTALLTRLDPLLTTATRACLTALAEGSGGLPAPGLDYWEIRDRRASLGLAAPILAGLETAPALLDDAGHRDLADRARTAARSLATAVDVRFAVHGYPRYADGPAGAPRDAAVTFLLPPFRAGVPEPRLRTAWQAAQTELRRPAGGLAPGAAWREDGISWTPETALFALTAAHTGRDQVASTWLGWLNAHRTRGGALPEKVLADGSPASVAPLAWTAALVVLTLEAGRPAI